MTAKIYAVVLNYNGRDVLPDCLSALEASQGISLKTIVVDNASPDGSVDLVAERFPSVGLIRLNTNSGFCEGNNVGMKAAMDDGADFVWLVNNDAAPAKDAAKAMLDTATSDPTVGVVGGKIYIHGTDRVLSSAGGNIDRRYILPISRGRGEKDSGQYDTPAEVDFISGASLFMRTEALKKTGLLDPRFHFYWEDVDLCLRIKEAGYKVLYVPGAVTMHRESYGFGAVKSPRSAYYGMRNRLLTASKHRLMSKGGLARVTMKILVDQYIINRNDGHPSPATVVMSSFAGAVDHVLGRYGPSPKWLESKRLAR